MAVVSRTRYKVACSRRLEPARVAAGRESRVVVEMENVSRSPTGLLLVEDRIPYVLGSRPRFVLDRVEPAGRRGVSYRIRSDVRGRFTVGPLTVRLTDPFGLVEMDRAFEATQTLTVTPHVTPLAHTRLGGEWTGAGENLARAVSMAGEDDVAPREYRYGDDLRRVHWRSTARRGELMVRREEQPWQSRCSLLLDCRRGAHRGEGPGSSFEWAVSAAASIGLHLSRQGYAVRLLTDTGTAVSSAAHDPSTVGSELCFMPGTSSGSESAAARASRPIRRPVRVTGAFSASKISRSPVLSPEFSLAVSGRPHRPSRSRPSA